MQTHAQLKDLARSIELEAIRQAALDPEPFVDVAALHSNELLTIRLMLAREYDKRIDRYGFDTHELLAERITQEATR